MESVCAIVPPYILEAIAENGTPAERKWALATLAIDEAIRIRLYETPLPPLLPDKGATGTSARTIFDAEKKGTLPGKQVRAEGGAASGDAAVDEAYDGLGATLAMYKDIFMRESIDDDGLNLVATVHFNFPYNNAKWNGTQMVFGETTSTLFNRFQSYVDIVGHELTHAVTQYTAGLEYKDQSGALNEHVSDVFGSLVKQYVASPKETAAQADWLIGAGVWAAGINGTALRSMRAPGTAYNDPVVGSDPQPAHMTNFVQTKADSGGVHTNSGIPNHAFYLAATSLGGNSWDRAGRIWYRVLTGGKLSKTANFLEFAIATITTAISNHGFQAGNLVSNAWQQVGVVISATGDDMLGNEVLLPDGQIVSTNGAYRLIYQLDGNLVLYRVAGQAPLWASGTDGRPVGVCIMQADGNLVIYGPGNEVIWATGTDGNLGSRLVVQDDANVVIYRSDGTPVWASNG